MKIIIAPKSFRDSMTALQAGKAMAQGALEACDDATLDFCPICDCGAGAISAMTAATGGKSVAVDVFDPMGAPIRSHFGLLGHSGGDALPGQFSMAAIDQLDDVDDADLSDVAVIEASFASAACGATMIAGDPLRMTSYGIGQLILAAIDAGARKIILVGGGAFAVDGGCGCLQAMGATFIAADGMAAAVGISGGLLPEIVRIDASTLDARLADVEVILASDQMLAFTGAAATIGGATAEVADKLTEGLEHLGVLIRRDVGADVSKISGAGVAGGLFGSLAAMCGAKISPGQQTIADAIRLPRRIASADLCITGQGRLDAKSSSPSPTMMIADLAKRNSKPAICIVGQIADDASADAFDAVYSMSDDDESAKAAMKNAEAMLKARTAQAVRKFLAGGR